MAFGFLAKNDNGSVLLSDSLLNYRLTEKRTILTGTNIYSTDINGTTRSTAIITYTGTNPIFSFKCLYNAAVIGTTLTSPNTWETTLQVANPPGTSVDIYIFDSTPPTASGGYGLDIFTDTGTRSYSITSKPMRIASVVTATGTYTTFPTGSYAVASSRFVFRYVVTDTGIAGSQRYINFWYSYGSRSTDNGVIISTNQVIRNYRSGSPGFVAKTYGPEYKLLLDVTSY